MDIKEYIKKIAKKVVHYDSNAQNPFLENRKYAYNPFKGAFSQTYVWIEENDNDEENI